MTPRCQKAVADAAKAAGRKAPTDAQMQAIEDQMSAQMRRLVRSDPNWHNLTTDQRMQAGAEAAMADIKAAADRKLANAERQIVKVAETEQRLQALQDSFRGTKGHDGTRAEALKR